MLGENADGERQRRRDSAMDTDTACDLGDVVVVLVVGGGDEGGDASAAAASADDGRALRRCRCRCSRCRRVSAESPPMIKKEHERARERNWNVT